MKKAQHLTINTIIIAAAFIALAVIIVFLIAQQGERFTKGTTDCEINQGTCIKTTAECLEKGGHQLGFKCKEEKPVCCKL